MLAGGHCLGLLSGCGDERTRSYIRHPDLYGPKSLRTQPFAVQSNLVAR
jgi:hypothetical protein